MKPLYRLIYTVLIIILAYCASCKKFVEIPPPKNQLVTEAVFADSASATAAVLGIYINMMQSVSLTFSNGGLTLYPALSSDELIPSGSNTDENEFYNNAVLAGNSINAALWLSAYKLIYNANACLEGLVSATNISQAQKNQLMGEVKFVRAFLYFNLLNLYGSVPLVTTTDYHKNQMLGRSTTDDIYASIISDLKDAQSLLKHTYPSAGRLRPNLFTASCLLAKVYLFEEKWQLAEQIASEVINSRSYSLETDLNKVFLASSNEAIWKLSPVFPGVETWEGYYFVPANSTVIPKYAMANSILAAFDSMDNRKTNWLKSNTVSGQEYYYPYKYKLGYDGLSIPKENYVVFRLAEQYLIRAESRAQQNNITGALEDLNVIRNRAELSNFYTSDQDTLLTEIAHERQVELFCEWGNRWLDLKRLNKATTVLPVVKGANWQSTDVLYPIPLSELGKNPALTQNAGY